MGKQKVTVLRKMPRCEECGIILTRLQVVNARDLTGITRRVCELCAHEKYQYTRT